MSIESLQDLKMNRQLGAGGFGEIFLANGPDQKQQYAVKKINKLKNTNKLNVEREVKAGRKLTHNNIIKFVEHFEDATNDYLVFEYIKGKHHCSSATYLSGNDLFTYFQDKRSFKPFSEKEAKKLFKQLLDAIAYTHKQGVVHLDIKLDNIMIEHETQKITLIDYGLCDYITEENKGQFNRRVGSEEYCPAELLDRRDSSFSGAKVDVWCLGVVLYTLLNASFPFDPKKRKQIIRDGGKHPTFHFKYAVGSKAQDLIGKMLKTNPEERISMEEVKSHSWLKSKKFGFFSF
jgi:serine/threonine protein kinase